MKKKTKKPIFDKRCPGAKMIVYGAILVMIAGVINAYTSWVLAVGVLGGAAETKDVIGYLVSICLQVGLYLLVGIDAILNRNIPSKGRSVMINCICVAAISVYLLVQGNTYVSSIVISGISFAGSVLAAIGAFRNRRVVSSN